MLTIRALARVKDIQEVYNLHFTAYASLIKYVSAYGSNDRASSE
jgi:hypothetical protein